MSFIRQAIFTSFSLLLIISCATAHKEKKKEVIELGKQMIDSELLKLPAGEYILDKTHASLIFRVNHLGLSRYTARFTRFDAKLQFDPANPEAAKVTATVDPSSIETDFPNSTPDFDKMLQGIQWLNVLKFPKIHFSSTEIKLTGKSTACVVGEFSMLGVTLPVKLATSFNGGYSGQMHPMDPSKARIGFSAHGSLERSKFGMTYGIPEKGSNMGVGDEVEFIIEAEFIQPKDVKKGK